jgi:single-strand DNA-binding protein
MAHVLVIQRNAHLAGEVRLEQVEGRDGRVARAQFTAISNVRWGSGEAREEEATAILWTVWGTQADNAARYLGKGSHVNVVGRVRNHTYEKDGQTVYGAERRSRHEFVDQMNAADSAGTSPKRT